MSVLSAHQLLSNEQFVSSVVLSWRDSQDLLISYRFTSPLDKYEFETVDEKFVSFDICI